MGPIVAVPWAAMVWLAVAEGWQAFGSATMYKKTLREAGELIRDANPEWWPTVLA